jgi:DNA-binding MarR family transcriptional regulator
MNFTPRQKQVMNYLDKHKFASSEQMADDLGANIDQMRMSLLRMVEDGAINSYGNVNNHRRNLYTRLTRTALERIVPPASTPLRDAIRGVLSDGVPRTADQIAECITGYSAKNTRNRLREMMLQTQVWRVDGLHKVREHYYSDRIFTVADIPDQPPSAKKVEVVPVSRSEAAIVREAKRHAKAAEERRRAAERVLPAVMEATILDPLHGAVRRICFADHWKPTPAQRAGRVAGLESSLNGIY